MNYYKCPKCNGNGKYHPEGCPNCGSGLIIDRTRLLTILKQKCKAHDWYYRQSDDYNVYTKGCQEHEEILELHKIAEIAGFGEEAWKIIEEP